MPNPEITVFTEADSDGASAIHHLCFPHDPWPPKAFSSLLDNGAAGFIARQAGQPIGLILVRPAADEAEILTFAVTPSHRGQGIGHDLLLAAMNWLKQNSVNRLLLEVAQTNTAAISLYTKAGFSKVGTRSGYYVSANGIIDADIMIKTLESR